MVRVVSAANLGFGDYGCGLSDREVDGVVWTNEDVDDIAMAAAYRRRVSKTRSDKPKKMQGGLSVMMPRIAPNT